MWYSFVKTFNFSGTFRERMTRQQIWPVAGVVWEIEKKYHVISYRGILSVWYLLLLYVATVSDYDGLQWRRRGNNKKNYRTEMEKNQTHLLCQLRYQNKTDKNGRIRRLGNRNRRAPSSPINRTKPQDLYGFTIVTNNAYDV